MNKKSLKKLAKNFTLELLEAIKEFGEGLPQPFESKYEHQKRLWRAMRGYPPRKITQRLYQLDKQGLIQKKKQNNRVFYQLTISGEQKLLLRTIFQKKYTYKDGSSCIISFDVPEEFKKHRQFLRRLLLQNGFISLQKSVLIGPKFLPKEFSDFLEDLKIRKYVTIIKGNILYQ